MEFGLASGFSLNVIRHKCHQSVRSESDRTDYGPTPDVFPRHSVAWREERSGSTLRSLPCSSRDGTVVPDANLCPPVDDAAAAAQWQASTAIGAWRDFAELDLANDAAIDSFVARFGDPDGRPAAGPGCRHPGLARLENLSGAVRTGMGSARQRRHQPRHQRPVAAPALPPRLP